jgi:hypothetical protein
VRTLAGVIGWFWIGINALGVLFFLFSFASALSDGSSAPGKHLIGVFALILAASPGMLLVWWSRRPAKKAPSIPPSSN